MGDRANIKVTGCGDVYLYTHWNGYELPKILKQALIRGRDRWDDPQYLARIIFCEMVRGYEMENSGYGISGECGDGEDRIITVNSENKTVEWPFGHFESMENYIKIPDEELIW